MHLKAGIDATEVDPLLWTYLGGIALLHRELTGAQLVVTSLRRAPSVRPSLHSPPPGMRVAAADLRRWELDDREMAEAFARELQRRWGGDLGVVLEPEWLTEDQLRDRGGRDNVTGHVHVELKNRAWPILL